MELADIVVGEYGTYTAEDLADAISYVLPDVDMPVPREIEPGEITVRFHDFHAEEIHKVGDYWADEHLGQYIGVKGQISKSTKKRPFYTQRVFECLRCGMENIVPQPEGDFQEPGECSDCERNGPYREDTSHPESHAKDYRRVRLKNPPDERDTETSERLDVAIEGDLLKWLDSHEINAGARVIVYGHLESEQRNNSEDFVLKAGAVDTQEDDLSNLDPEPEEREEIEAYASGEYGDPYERLAESVAPSIMGVDTVEGIEYLGEERSKVWWLKLGAAVSGLFQGYRKFANGDPYRGTSHVLAIGDPSTGKSTILDWVGEVSPRSASTSGKGASAAGLTAAAVQDNLGDGNRWTLEAGVLVQGNGGVAVVDELDKMEKDAVSSMHGALERQRVEISKAGINATLKAETALLAAGNPKDSRFTKYEQNHEQIDMVGSLLDRFDLVFILMDDHYEERDSQIGGHIVDSWTEAAKLERQELDEDESKISPAIDTDLLKKWVAMSRQIQPRIFDDSVKEHISDFYVSIRGQNDGDNGRDDQGPIPATARSLEGVLRLAEAIARVELSEEITMRHADIAIQLVKASLNDIGYDEETGENDIDALTDRKSETNRELDSKIRGMVKELSTQKNGASVEDLTDNLTASGEDLDKVEHRIEKLKRQGELYNPETGRIRTT
jgi:replicative DNA helicase Mcm